MICMTKQIRVLVVLLVVLSGNLSCSAQKKASAPAKQPNILMILVDDFGWRDIHAYGSSFYESPNMDKLIGESLKFTQAYSTYPRCVPSRYSIMTGSHPARLKGDGEGRDGEAGFTVHSPNISIGQAMKNAGYTTFYIGKWHLGGEDKAPGGVGFDQSVAAGQAGATSSHFAPYNITRGGTSGKEKPIPDLDDAPKDEYLTDRLTSEAIKLLKTDAKGDKPFFGILAHYAVHTPIQGKQEYIQYFREKLKKNPQTGPDYEPESAGENKLKQDNVTYAAMIKSVDDGVGRILKTLDELGIAGNTIVIVTSDHGGLSARGNKRELATTNRPLRAGKGHLYEGGLRVPLFIRWPGVVKGGTETNSVVQGVDHFATICAMGGAEVPREQIHDGTSYIDVIKQGKTHTDRTIFWHNGAPRPVSTADIYSSAIRKGDYKLIDFFGLGKKELYNLKDDIGEKQDISAKHPEIVKQLYEELDAWRKKVKADMKIKPASLSEAEKAVRGVSTDAADDKKAQRKEERKELRKAEKN